MKAIDKIVMAVGALDVGYIGWVVGTSITSGSGQISGLWSNVVAFGLPFPELQVIAVAVFYLSILVCGISLLIRSKKFVWLNYVQFPFRVLLVVPTLYPLFYIVAKAGVELGFVVSLILLSLIEITRVYTVYRWQQNGA